MHVTYDTKKSEVRIRLSYLEVRQFLSSGTAVEQAREAIRKVLKLVKGEKV